MSLLHCLVSSQGKQVKNAEKKADISSQETRNWEKELGEGEEDSFFQVEKIVYLI